MTPRQFEKITGHKAKIRRTHGYAEAETTCACSGKSIKIIVIQPTQDRALAQLLENIYGRHCRVVFGKQAWRCAECGRVAPLQADHIISRARGQRNDRVENLAGKCSECHGIRHGSTAHKRRS